MKNEEQKEQKSNEVPGIILKVLFKNQNNFQLPLSYGFRISDSTSERSEN